MAGKGEKNEKCKSSKVHFKKWEPVRKMEGYNSKMGTAEEYNSKTGADKIVFMVVAGERAKEYHKE